MWWSSLLLFISLNSFAIEKACEPAPKLPNLDPMFKEIESAVGYRAVSDEELAKAPCKTLTPPSYEKITNFLSNFQGKSKKTVHGVELKNESKVLIEAFKMLTTDQGIRVSNGIRVSQFQIQDSFKINPKCESVTCAVQKIWGEELGLKLLYMMVKYNYNGSELANYNSSRRFRISELNDVLMSLEDLPSELVPLGYKNQRLTISDLSPSVEAGEIYAESSIEIYRNWSYEPSLSRQYILFHELGHNIAEQRGDFDVNKGWLKLSGWEEMAPDEWAPNDGACFVSLYSMSSPYEDMAEVITMYRYNPQGLKKLCPEKYELVKKKVFKGREYLDPNSCN